MANNKPSASGADAARVVAAQLRAKQKADARRRSTLLAVGAVALVAIFAVAVMFILKSTNSGEVVAPSAADASGGIQVGPGGVAGAEFAADAVRLDIYEDPICPFCGLFSEITQDELDFLLATDEIVIYYHPIAFLDGASKGTKYSTRAASAFATVAEYDPEHFFAFVHELMSERVQPEENTEGLTNDEIAQVARDAGVSEDAIAKLADGEFKRWVAQATEQSSIDGVRGTPTLRVAGVDFGGWDTPGNIAAAVAFVKEYGAEAFAALINDGVQPEPVPSASPSAS